MATPQHDTPTQTSYYVDDALYDWLLSLAREWQRAKPIQVVERPDDTTRLDCEAILYAEARFADELQLESWLDCYDKECIYWIPSIKSMSDPRKEVTLEFQDRRRLEDRVARIQTGFAYSMIPPIRTRHLLSNIEFWYGTDKHMLARANFLIDALVRGRHRILSGWCGYALKNCGTNWLITVKQINLIDADLPQENNTFFL